MDRFRKQKNLIYQLTGYILAPCLRLMLLLASSDIVGHWCEAIAQMEKMTFFPFDLKLMVGRK